MAFIFKFQLPSVLQTSKAKEKFKFSRGGQVKAAGGASVVNCSKSETATFGAKTRQIPPKFFSLKTATILAQTATILEISDFFP